MRKVLKGLGWTVATIAGLAIAFFIFAYLKTENSRAEVVKLEVASIELPTDEASLKEGARQTQVKGCYHCHGEQLQGGVIANDPAIGYLGGPNITPGEGSLVKDYKTEDWIRTIRYSVNPAGRKLHLMPAPDFVHLTNEELGMMIAFLKTVKPVDNTQPESYPGPLARVLYATGQMPNLFPYEEVKDVKTQPLDKVAVENTVTYGKYLANGCVGCHGEGFSGGKIPGVPPDWPAASNLTPSGQFASYSLAEFSRVLKTGVKKDGKQIDPHHMPWSALAAMTDLEVEALFSFLKTLEPKAEHTR